MQGERTRLDSGSGEHTFFFLSPLPRVAIRKVPLPFISSKIESKKRLSGNLEKKT